MIESASVIASRTLAVGKPALFFSINDQNKAGAEAVAGTFISNFLSGLTLTKHVRACQRALTFDEFLLVPDTGANQNPTRNPAMLAIDAKPERGITGMEGVRSRNLFPELPTFQLPCNIRCSICFLLQPDNCTTHEHSYQLFQPLE
jgi:hypothetical protein